MLLLLVSTTHSPNFSSFWLVTGRGKEPGNGYVLQLDVGQAAEPQSAPWSCLGSKKAAILKRI